jgi:hypothetical protein
MRLRGRRAKTANTAAQAEAQAALAVVAQHAEAGWHAQTDVPNPSWAAPQMWSQAWPPTTVMEATPGTETPPTPSAQPAQPAPSAAPSAPPAPVPPTAASPQEAIDAIVVGGASSFDIPTELVRVLEVVTTMCDHVIEYIEADRAERRMMIEALTRLTRTISDQVVLPAAPNGNGHYVEELEPSPERLIGGSMPSGPERIVDVREPDQAVEVRCRFGDRWVDGFEICEVLKEERGVRYRLRRRIDGFVLPELFDAVDIRHVETFEELTSTPNQQKYWSPL